MRTIPIALLLFFLWVTAGWCVNSASNFGGVGIDGVALPDGRIVVRQLVKGGPADLAGMKLGDIITQIDGTPTQGHDFNKMVQTRLRGQAGTKVRLKVKRQGHAELSFLLTRRQLVLRGN